MYKHILISTDGSDVAQKGVDHGLSLAKASAPRSPSSRSPNVFPSTRTLTGIGWVPGPNEMADYEAGQKKWAGEVLARMKAAADKLGVEAETLHVPDALPAEAIIETAKSRGCGLIVMSSHGRRGLGRLLLGSQTSEVLAHSPVPVLVVR